MGLGKLEANVRFERAGDGRRYQEAAQVAENIWACGIDWTGEPIRLLECLLEVVEPEEALARAVAELLEVDAGGNVTADRLAVHHRQPLDRAEPLAPAATTAEPHEPRTSGAEAAFVQGSSREPDWTRGDVSRG